MDHAELQNQALLQSQALTTNPQKRTKAIAPKSDEAAGVDWTKPVELGSWCLPYHIGVNTDHALHLGGHVTDGFRTSGIVKRLTHYPGGYVVAMILLDGGLEQFGEMVFFEGHGVVRR